MAIKETELYAPVKTLLQGQGYKVKAEIGPADIVAIRGDEPPVIVELKTGFSLALVHQAIERLSITDNVYVAVPRRTGRASWRALKSNIKLCRRLGIGLITIRLSDGFAEIHCDPVPYAPRKSIPKRTRLLREFARRQGDPNLAGTSRTKIVTAYRQDAERILAFVRQNGPTKASVVAEQTGVQRARVIMADNHYGWFKRVERGIYAAVESEES